jgi:hypothetical protein
MDKLGNRIEWDKLTINYKMATIVSIFACIDTFDWDMLFAKTKPRDRNVLIKFFTTCYRKTVEFPRDVIIKFTGGGTNIPMCSFFIYQQSQI